MVEAAAGGDARPFEHAGDHRGILCVHGFTGTPFEMHVLGRTLAARGFTVIGPTLAGHATSAAALNETTWRDWVGSAERALDDLRARCDRVAVVGLSLGGLIALHLARLRGPKRIAAIGVMSAPLWLPGYARAAIPALGELARRVPSLSTIGKPGGGSDLRDATMRARNPALPAFPVRALESLLEFTEIVRDEVPAVYVPAFVAHGRRDHTAPPACSDELVRRLGSRDLRYCVLAESFHVVTLDVERDILADELGRFLEERL